MDSIVSGIFLVLIGLFLSFLTYKKYRLFWEFFNTRYLRKWLGDSFTTTLLYLVSCVFIFVGILLCIGLIQ